MVAVRCLILTDVERDKKCKMEEEIICEARERNLKISIVKGILSNGLELKRKFNKKELADYFCFRQSDLFYYDTVFFDIEGENYY